MEPRLKFIECHTIFDKFHSGFTTILVLSETALPRVTNRILMHADRVNILLLDLTASFDAIDHAILLGRLHKWVGISSTASNWCHSYLTNSYLNVCCPPSMIVWPPPNDWMSLNFL